MNAPAPPPPLPLEEAQARLLALAAPLPIERVDPESALGRYLSEPLAARRTHPPADQSAMDGYAVAPGDLAGPWQVIGESAAGHPFSGTVARGQAVRISTGALLPDGAGSVVLQEDIAREGTRIALSGEAPRPGDKHIRRQGLDFRNGDPLLPVGTRMGAAQLALAISAGHSHVAVRRLPRVAILDNGDELASHPHADSLTQIPASNGAMLAAMAAAVPVDVVRLGPVADSREALAEALGQASQFDLIVTSGGASVGDHDLVRPALEAWGATIDFWRIAIKPGKPLLVATRDQAHGKQMILGLPGNPVSSHVTAFLFMLPLLRAFSGATSALPVPLKARLAAPLKAIGARREFVRARWDGNAVMPQSVQDSGFLTPLAASNVLIDRPSNAPAAEVGTDVPIYLLESGGIA